MRVGIFGGTFNPPHIGHLTSLQEVLKKSGLGKIHVIPAFQNPLKTPLEGASAEQRYDMTKLAVEAWSDQFIVDDQEIKRGGKSYTIDTIKNIRKKVEANDLYLIIGMDKLDELEEWKDLNGILTEANLIVTTRPGFEFPQKKEELPKTICDLVEEFDFNFVELKTGRNIQFIRIKDVPASGTEIRKWIRIGKNVEKYVPLAVESYIKKNKMYQPLGDKVGDFEKFTQFCANTLFMKKGINVRGFDIRPMTAPSEFTLIASGTSTRHAASLAENVIMAVKEEYNVNPQSLEGIDEGRWVVVDYGSLIIHIFYDYVRNEYALENLWNQGKDMALKDPTIQTQKV